MTTLLPIQGGKAQSRDTAIAHKLEELQHEIDSIKVQKQVLLDLLEYQLNKDTLQEPTKE